jgi:hypothetical protein
MIRAASGGLSVRRGGDPGLPQGHGLAQVAGWDPGLEQGDDRDVGGCGGQPGAGHEGQPGQVGGRPEEQPECAEYSPGSDSCGGEAVQPEPDQRERSGDPCHAGGALQQAQGPGATVGSGRPGRQADREEAIEFERPDGTDDTVTYDGSTCSRRQRQTSSPG